MRGLFLLPTVYRLNASELAATEAKIVEHGHDENLSSGYCRCAQVNAIISGTAMVDEQTSGLNLG